MAGVLGRGLPNFGNTCYLNSVLQCLRYSKPFVFMIREHDSSKDNPFLKHFVDLLFADATRRTLTSFIGNLAVINKEFLMLRQCDAHELYLFLIDYFFENNKKYTNPFEGKFKSTIECQTCNNKSITSTRFISMSLDMQPNVTNSVSELIEQFGDFEFMDNIDCETCNEKQSVMKNIEVESTPDILVVHLKRFIGLQKLMVNVEIEKTIQLNDDTYTLYSMCNHMGGTSGGHYTAACRKQNGNWILCNDDYISDVFSLPNKSNTPYVLFYFKTKK